MTTPLLSNILNQPEALRAVADYQFGDGWHALVRAAALLQSKKRIVLSGMGASFHACVPLQYTLSALGIHASAIETAELLYFLPAAIDHDTAVILVSRSGESVEVTKALPLIRERGATAIGIVNVVESTLAREADQAVVLRCPSDQMVAVQSYTATLVTFALLAAVISGEADAAKTQLSKTIDLLTDFVPAWMAASEDWNEFLSQAAPMYLLGRGPALGAVQEGVLLMHETAKAPTVGLSVAQFRHGPVEVVDSRFRAIVIGTAAATRELDIELAKDLGRMGGQARWLGPDAEQAELEPLCSWPSAMPRRASCRSPRSSPCNLWRTVMLNCAECVQAIFAGRRWSLKRRRAFPSRSRIERSLR